MGTTLDLAKFDSRKIKFVQITKLNATLNEATKPSGGTLQINISIGISDLIDDQYIDAKVKLDIKGLPSEDSLDAAFEIEIRAKARWAFDVPLTEITDDERQIISEILCQPAFLLASIEAKSIADKFGVGKVAIPFDLTALERGEEKPRKPRKVSKSKSESKTVKVKATTKKPVA